MSEWKELEVMASLGPVPPDDERNHRSRLAMQLGGASDGKWEPSPIGEVVAYAILTLTVRTATPEHATPAYAALEDGALDRIINGLQRSIIREVRRAEAAL